MEIDHVVLAARSRAEAETALDRAGLGVARGRTIPGAGLSNLVVPLKPGQLLEILYPNGEAPDPDAPPLLRYNRAATAAHPGDALVPVAWLVVVEEEARLRELAAANDEAVAEVPAQGPGYPPYMLVGFGANLVRRWLPVLIHWPEGSPPLDAPHRRSPVGITRVDVAGPEHEIEHWCGERPLGLNAVPGTAGPLRVEVGFTDGPPIAFGPAA